jgi:hypothetical protein
MMINPGLLLGSPYVVPSYSVAKDVDVGRYSIIVDIPE